MTKFEQPIVVVKHVKKPPELSKKCYRLMHVGFQSTKNCTYPVSMNCMRSMYMLEGGRRDKDKQMNVWEIEMNEAR